MQIFVHAASTNGIYFYFLGEHANDLLKRNNGDEFCCVIPISAFR